MSLNQMATICIVFLAVRIHGGIRRWRQPRLRGPEWLFGVNVQPDFYAGPGRRILHRYWMRIFVPLALDIPIAMAIVIPGRARDLACLLLAQAAFIHVNHVFSVDLAERQARQFAVPNSEQPVTSLVLSLKTRRLTDYSNRELELALALSSIIAVAWLIRYYLAAPEHHDFRLVFGRPIFLLYAQVGFLFAKFVVIAWRTPVPTTQAEEHLKAREEARKLYLKVCDFGRVFYAVALLCWPIFLSASSAGRGRLSTIGFALGLAITVVLTVWEEIKRKQVLTVALRVHPRKLPEFLGQSEAWRWPLCYQPCAPMLVLRGAHGYSLNLANALAQFGAVYLAGLVVVMTVLRVAS